MPIYEYACQSCEHTLDELQKMNDDPLLECPECGEPDLKRLVSAPRFRLKGEGWYETDFKKDNQKNVLKNDSEPAKSADGDKSDKKDKGDSGDKSDKKDKGSSTDKSGKTEKKTPAKSESKAKSSSKDKTE